MIEPVTSLPPIQARPSRRAPTSKPAAVSALVPLPADGYGPMAGPAPVPEQHPVQRKVVAPLLRWLSSLPLVDDAILAISRQREPIPTGPAVPNFGVVSPSLFRGGLPSRLGYEALARQGIRTVVNLAAEHPEESEFLPQLGMRSIALLLHPFRPPTMEQAFRFLSIVLDPANEPLYVHCYHGSDRTGALIGVYRIAHDGWTAEQAIAEMRLYGLHEDYHEDKVRFVRQFEKVWREGAGGWQLLAPLPANK